MHENIVENTLEKYDEIINSLDNFARTHLLHIRYNNGSFFSSSTFTNPYVDIDDEYNLLTIESTNDDCSYLSIRLSDIEDIEIAGDLCDINLIDEKRITLDKSLNK